MQAAGKTSKSRSFQLRGSCIHLAAFGAAAMLGTRLGAAMGKLLPEDRAARCFQEGLVPPWGFTPDESHRDPPASGYISVSPCVSAAIAKGSVANELEDQGRDELPAPCHPAEPLSTADPSHGD